MEIWNLINLSAIITLAIFTLIYFGRLVSEHKIEKYEKNIDLARAGIFFVLLCLVFPAVLVFYYHQQWQNFSIVAWTVYLVIHIVIAVICSHYIEYVKNKKLGLQKDYNKYKIIDSLFNKAFEKYVIFLCLLSVLIFLTIAIALISPDLIQITTVLIFSFVNLSIIAAAFGISNANYSNSIITLSDGKELKGTLVKFGDFIHLVVKGKDYFINKDQVKLVEIEEKK